MWKVDAYLWALCRWFGRWDGWIMLGSVVQTCFLLMLRLALKLGIQFGTSSSSCLPQYSKYMQIQHWVVWNRLYIIFVMLYWSIDWNIFDVLMIHCCPPHLFPAQLRERLLKQQNVSQFSFNHFWFSEDPKRRLSIEEVSEGWRREITPGDYPLLLILMVQGTSETSIFISCSCSVAKIIGPTCRGNPTSIFFRLFVQPSLAIVFGFYTFFARHQESKQGKQACVFYVFCREQRHLKNITNKGLKSLLLATQYQWMRSCFIKMWKHASGLTLRIYDWLHCILLCISSLSGGREHEGIVVSVQHGTAFLDFYCADAHGVAMCEIQEGYMEISWDIHTISFNGTWVAPSNLPLNSLDCCMGRERRRKGYRTNISRIIIHQSWMHTHIYIWYRIHI